MRTLYFRVVLATITILFISMFVALLATNFYYETHLKKYYDEKLLHMANQMKQLHSLLSPSETDAYLNHLGQLGFQILLTDGQQSKYYGGPINQRELSADQVEKVLAGKTYYGILEEETRLILSSYFQNSMKNSIGVPLQIDGKSYALFVRPDLNQQFGEVRWILAVLLGFTFLISILLIAILTRYIVKPIRSLTDATQKIVDGQYDVTLDVNRRDEIGYLANQFTHMAQSLKQLDAMRQEFVANVSHEIQSPLTSIQGFVQEAMNPDTSAEDKQRYLDIIDRESRRLSSLSKQLLTLASLDKESSFSKRSVFRLDEQIRQVAITMEWQWTDKEIDLDMDLEPTTLTADANLMHLVWVNLMSNAIKFTDAGGMISIQLRNHDDQITVCIRDTGMGIPQTELPYIFDRFYKVDKARNRTIGGSGLGLSIVHKIIQLHRGGITVESDIEQGTTFHILLPRS